MIEITEPKEGVDGFNGCWRRPGHNGRQFGRVHADTTTSNYHAKELDLWFAELTFGQLEGQSEIVESLQD